MSKKTKCCKKYKRGGKYCRSCPLRRGGQYGKTDSRQTAKTFFAPVAKASFKTETLADGYSTSCEMICKPGVHA